MEKFVDAYKSGAIDEPKLTAGLKRYISKATTETRQDYHIEAAKQLRKDYLEEHKDDKNTSEPKSENSNDNNTKKEKN